MILTGIGGGGQAPVVGRVNHNTIVDGDGILVADMTEPDMLSEMLKAAAVVTNRGGAMSHAAVVCTARGITFVVGTKTATLLSQGAYIEVDPSAGTVTLLD